MLLISSDKSQPEKQSSRVTKRRKQNYHLQGAEILLSFFNSSVASYDRRSDTPKICKLFVSNMIGPSISFRPPWLAFVSRSRIRDKMPTLLYRFMRPGLIWNMDDRDLDLTETRDMLLGSRRRRQKNVSEGSNYDDIKFDQERHHRKNSKSEKEERKV